MDFVLVAGVRNGNMQVVGCIEYKPLSQIHHPDISYSHASNHDQLFEERKLTAAQLLGYQVSFITGSGLLPSGLHDVPINLNSIQV